ncbi:hypothetical protein SEA_CURSIVE_238 [Streptomyces phage Cursive]
MKFEELNNRIPYVTGGMKHILSTSPYDGVTLRMPGRHENDTETPGGDFVVEITDDTTSWESKQFTHQHIFDDFQDKTDLDEDAAKKLMSLYAKVVMGEDPDDMFKYGYPKSEAWEGTVKVDTLLAALQCLAVAEHRRYARYEAKMGGRFLPARFTTGIVYGLWTADDAKMVVRKGRPGVEMLERLNGKPPTLQELASGLQAVL